jgi:hypothetical protein
MGSELSTFQKAKKQYNEIKKWALWGISKLAVVPVDKGKMK